MKFHIALLSLLVGTTAFAQSATVDYVEVRVIKLDPFNNEKDSVVQDPTSVINLDRHDKFNVRLIGRSSKDKNVKEPLKSEFIIKTLSDGSSSNRFGAVQNLSANFGSPNYETLTVTKPTTPRLNLGGEASHPTWFGVRLQVGYQLTEATGVTLDKKLKKPGVLTFNINSDTQYEHAFWVADSLHKAIRLQAINSSDNEATQGRVDNLLNGAAGAVQTALELASVHSQELRARPARQIVGSLYRVLLGRSGTDDDLYANDRGAFLMAQSINCYRRGQSVCHVNEPSNFGTLVNSWSESQAIQSVVESQEFKTRHGL